jgi:membrane protein implicated in regulation of membrane protease activity
MVVVWVLVGLALLGFELHHLAFYALFVAVGAFAAAGVAVAAPGAVVAQLITMVLTSVLGIIAVRPFVSRVFEHRHDQLHVARGVHGGITGQQALTADVVGGAGRPGHVRLAGERWLAVSGDDRPIPPDTAVVVTAVTGTTLTVWPLSARELDDSLSERPTNAPESAEEE